jgi:hypothetical protein
MGYPMSYFGENNFKEMESEPELTVIVRGRPTL